MAGAGARHPGPGIACADRTPVIPVTPARVVARTALPIIGRMQKHPCATARRLGTLMTALAAAALAGLATGCGGDDSDEATTFRFGRDSGECIGYCHRHLALSGGRVDLVATPKCLGRTVGSTLHHSMELDAPTRESLHSAVREAAPFIRHSAPVLGCPDCADGGASWVELPGQGVADKRVTYDSGRAPPELARLDGLLVEISARFVLPDARTACGLS